MEKANGIFSERVWFGTLLILGYLGMVFYTTVQVHDADARQMARDSLLVIGPLLGVIVNATWKADKVDGVNANTAAVLADKSPDLSAATVVAAPGPSQVDATLSIPAQPATGGVFNDPKPSPDAGRGPGTFGVRGTQSPS